MRKEALVLIMRLEKPSCPLQDLLIVDDDAEGACESLTLPIHSSHGETIGVMSRSNSRTHEQQHKHSTLTCSKCCKPQNLHI